MRIFLAVLIVMIACGRYSVAAPQTLSDLVTDDVAICVEVRDLDRHWPALTEHPCLVRLRSTWLWPVIQLSRPWQNWQALEKHVEAKTGETLTAHLLRLGGRRVLLAVYLPANEQPRGVIFLQGTKLGTTESLLENWRKSAPDREFEEIHDKGQSYWKTARGDRNVFFAVRDDLLVLSDHAQLVRDVLVRQQQPATDLSLTAAPWWQRAIQDRGPQELLFVVVNGRAWDRTLENEGKSDPGTREFLAWWEHVEVAIGRLSLESGVQARVELLLDEQRSTDEWRTVARAFSSQHRAMRDRAALAVIRTELPVRELLSFLHRHLTADDVRAWNDIARAGETVFTGKPFWEEVVPELLSSSMILLEQTGSPVAPVRATWVSLLPTSNREKMRTSLENAITVGLNLLAMTANDRDRAARSQFVVKQSDERQSRWQLVRPFGFWQPVCELTVSTIEISSWPEQLSAEAGASLHTSVDRQSLAREQAGIDAPPVWMWVDLVALVETVLQEEPSWSRLLSGGDAAAEPRIRAQLLHAVPLLTLAESAWLAAEVSPTRIRVSAGLTATPKNPNNP